MRSYLFVAFWWFVVILLYHFEVNFSSFLGSYHFSTDKRKQSFFVPPLAIQLRKVYNENEFCASVSCIAAQELKE